MAQIISQRTSSATRRLVLLVALPLLLLLAGCKAHSPLDPEEMADVSLSIPGLSFDGTRAFIDGEQVTKVRILVFNQAGKAIDANQLFENPTDLADWLHVQAHVGAKDIYVVANERDAMTAELEKVLFEKDLLDLDLPDDGSDQKSFASSLVMTGKATATLQKDRTTQVTVELSRVVAKISLDLKKDVADNVVVQEVSISRLPTHSKLFTPDPFTLGENYTYSKQDELTLTSTAVPYIADKELYVYENIGSATDTVGRAPLLTVKALYNGVPTTYTAYINDATTTGVDHHYSLHRNHHYQVTGTITGIGKHTALTLSTKVLPWDKEEITWKLEPPRLVSIDPQPQQGQHFYATDEQPVSFKIKIRSSYSGAIWHATLTNALDFRLVTTEGAVLQGRADGTTEYTVRVIATKPAGNGTRSTRLLFTTDLLQVQGEGSTGSVGILIEQKPSV